VTEEEFRSKLYVLGLDYQAAIKAMNAAPDQYLKERYRRQGYEVMAEISALERVYRSQGKAPLIVTGPVVELRPDIKTWQAPDGSGDTLIELDDGKRFRQSGNQIRHLPEPEPTNPWIEYHDQLVKEWFNGELALIDDLYPDRPKRQEDPIFGPLARGVVQAAKILGVLAVIAAVIFISTLYLWA